jgi:hypothetical protein
LGCYFSSTGADAARPVWAAHAASGPDLDQAGCAGFALAGIAALGNPKLVQVAFDAGFAVSRGRQ